MNLHEPLIACEFIVLAETAAADKLLPIVQFQQSAAVADTLGNQSGRLGRRSQLNRSTALSIISSYCFRDRCSGEQQRNFTLMAISPQDISAANADRPAFLIRAARPQDLHNLTDLLARSFHSPDGVWGWTYPLLRLGIYEDLRNRIAAPAPHQVFLVAVPPIAQIERSNTAVPLAGGVEIAQRRSLWHSRPERSLYISNLAVAADYRRQGVATQMLAACERIAVRWKIPDLYLHVMEDNHAAQQLYHQAGFELLRADGVLASWFGQPRQLYLHKHLPRSLFS